MDESYWKYIEPIWENVSIYDGEEIFIEQFSRLTEKQQILLSSHWTQSEILNGGLGQFFSNSTGVLAPEAAHAFLMLGMPTTAKAIEGAMLFFGTPYPRDRSIRENILEDFFDKFGEDAIPLEEYEDIVATTIEEENGGFWVAADAFGKQP